jgi:NUMOD3 motif-containing protein
MIWYTYQYLREDGSPFYVGKGHENRAFIKRENHWPPKDRSRIVFQYWDEEGVAFAYERYLIDFWGRKDLGTGILHNKTDGGEGASGTVVGEETRRKLSVASKGRKYPKEFGQAVRERQRGNKNGVGIRSAETRAKISLSKQGKKLPLEHCRSIGLARKGVPWTPARWAAQAAKVGK